MVKLLNGEAYGKEEILTLMADDNFYYGHLGKHALSSSSLRSILDSPNRYLEDLKKPRKESEALIIGKLVHECFLEPDKFYAKQYIDTDRTNSKIFLEAVEQHGEGNVYKTKTRNICEWIVQKLHNNEKIMSIRNNAEVEVPGIKMYNGIAIRGKADIIKGDTIYDLKTTIADLENFAKWDVDKKNYDLQAYIYTRLFNLNKFAFIAINKVTRDIGLITVPEEVLARGEVKFNLAIKAYNDIFANGLEEAEYKLDQYLFEAEAR